MDAQYFINKFEAIPEEMWCEGVFEDTVGRRCANGHCGVYNGENLTEESIALWNVFKNTTIHWNCGGYDIIVDPASQYSNVAAIINNGKAQEYQQATPKQRILAALRDIQSLEEQQKAIDQTKQILEDGNRRSKNHEVYMQA